LPLIVIRSALLTDVIALTPSGYGVWGTMHVPGSGVEAVLDPHRNFFFITVGWFLVKDFGAKKESSIASR